MRRSIRSIAVSKHIEDARRRELMMEYRRHYEQLQDSAEYQRALCGMAVWSDQNPRALAGGMGSAFRYACGGRQLARTL